MADRRRATRRTICWCSVLVALAATALSAGTNDSPVLVRLLVRNAQSVSPVAGVLIADDPAELRILDWPSPLEMSQWE